MRPTLREAARIKGNDAVGRTALIDHLSNQYLDQRAMVPEGSVKEVLQDRSPDIDQGGDLLGILTIHVGE
jgi:hypothetical protein